MRACSVASVGSHSLWPCGLQPARLLCPWNSAGKNTGVGCIALLQVIFPSGIEHASPASPALQADSLLLSHWGSPQRAIVIMELHVPNLLILDLMGQGLVYVCGKMMRPSVGEIRIFRMQLGKYVLRPEKWSKLEVNLVDISLNKVRKIIRMYKNIQ